MRNDGVLFQRGRLAIARERIGVTAERLQGLAAGVYYVQVAGFQKAVQPAYRLLIKNSIEEKIRELQKQKNILMLLSFSAVEEKCLLKVKKEL